MATIAVDARPVSDPVPLVRKHHWLVRVTHWMNIPLLLRSDSERDVYLLGRAGLQARPP